MKHEQLDMKHERLDMKHERLDILSPLEKNNNFYENQNDVKEKLYH